MKNKYIYIIVLLLTALLLISIEIRHQTDIQRISTLTAENAELKQDITWLRYTNDQRATTIEMLTNVLKDTREADTEVQQPKVPEAQKTSRSAEVEGKRRTMEVTAYDLSYQSCQKHPGHPLYGITASGKYAEAWNTIAAGPELPFGAKVYIPFFKDKPNGGVFTVHDRGGGVKDGRIDVYMESYADCMEFGRRQLEVWVME